jgi:hypothetical protein
VDFDTAAYLCLGIAFVAVLSVLLYLRPPGWRVLSGLELVFIVLALMSCITILALRIFLIAEIAYLLLATGCFAIAMSRRSKLSASDEASRSVLTTKQFRWLAVTYLVVLARLLLIPFLPFMFR